MRLKIIVILFMIVNYVYAECYELDYADCIYWSTYCEWDNDSNLCIEIGSGTGGGTGGGSADGPYDYMTITES